MISTMLMLGGAAQAGLAAPQAELIYQSACVACHGVDGAGALPGVPDLTIAGGPLALDDDVLLKRTVEGFQSPGSPMAMPPRGGNPELGDEDLKAAIRYMRERFGSR